MSEIKSYAQNWQDFWVLENTENKMNGYFVDFGACDGIVFSNTYLLEKEFEWTGIVCEPNKNYHQDLQKNRSAKIDLRCVYSKSGEMIPFLNVENHDELSAIESYAYMDEHTDKRKRHTQSLVETVSLNDLLKQHDAPAYIDYLSIDTEGSEFDILSNFNFENYYIKLITVEHNWTPYREKIYDLLVSKGYKRDRPEISRWDDWYIKD